jgi:hypothetical protein
MNWIHGTPPNMTKLRCTDSDIASKNSAMHVYDPEWDEQNSMVTFFTPQAGVSIGQSIVVYI